MRYKKIQLVVGLMTVLLSFQFGSCEGTETPPDSSTIRIVATDPAYDLVSDGISRVRVSWDGQSGYTTSPLWILLPPEEQIPDDPPQVNIQSSGSAWVTWHGRKYAAGYGTRTLPVPLGTQEIRARIYSGTSRQVNVNFVANSYDSDADDFSDAVEDENNGLHGQTTPIIDENGNTHYDWWVSTDANRPPTIPTTIGLSNLLYPNRGTHDYSIARGTVSSGTLYNGLRIAYSGTGYQYWWGTEPPGQDNWGVLELINLVERVGRRWHLLGYPNLITSMDMSVQFGGSFPPHTQHQNGLEVDMRYIRNDGSSGEVNFDVNPGDYSQQRTQALIDLIQNEARVYRIYVDSRASLTGSKIQAISGHHHHFHVWLSDPD